MLLELLERAGLQEYSDPPLPPTVDKKSWQITSGCVLAGNLKTRKQRKACMQGQTVRKCLYPYFF